MDNPLGLVEPKRVDEQGNEKDATDDVNDVKALLHLNEEFSQQVSLRRASQSVAVQPISDIASINFLSQTLFEHAYPRHGVCDPCRPVRTKGHPKVATRIRSSIETSTKNRRKRSCGYCGEQGHISTDCGKRKATMSQNRGDEE